MSQADLSDLLAKHGHRWQVERTASPAGWVAVQRPTATALHILAARNLDELQAKIEAAP